MPNVSFESKIRSVDLRIEINDISEETANRIREFIQAQIAAADPFAKIADRLVERDAAMTEPLPEIKEDPETEEKTAVGSNGRASLQKRIRGREAYAPIMEILTDAKANPVGYEWRWTTARVFCEEWDAVKAFSDCRSVGAVLSGIAEVGIIKKQDKDAYHRDRTYYLPFPVVADEPKKPASLVEETPKLSTVADRIREYHAGSGLTNADLSDLIGYPESVIKAWEAGTSVPSVEGKHSLENLFGKHIFDGVQKPVIW